MAYLIDKHIVIAQFMAWVPSGGYSWKIVVPSLTFIGLLVCSRVIYVLSGSRFIHICDLLLFCGSLIFFIPLLVVGYLSENFSTDAINERICRGVLSWLLAAIWHVISPDLFGFIRL